MYITEIELEEHDINKHVLPQLGNFISFIQSASKVELNYVRDFLYNEIRKNKAIFEKLQKDTGKEVHQLLDNSMEDLEILLLIDRINPELSIGLSQIEKAIKVKIRKIEVSMFLSDKKDEIILFSDSERYQDEVEEAKEAGEYSEEYHLENKSDEMRAIINDLLAHISDLNILASPMKHYIGFYKNNIMIFSCVIRKNNIIFYSKAKINEIKIDDIKLSFRDVSKIGHYTNHLPTEIIVSRYDDLQYFFEYLNRLSKKY